MMSVVKFWILSLGLLFSGMLAAQPGDTLYVWAPSGLNVRETPSVSGKKLGKLETGAWLRGLRRTDISFSTQVIAPRPDQFETNIYLAQGSEEGLRLSGHWVEIVSGDLRGYVVDLYLLPFAVPDTAGSLKQFVMGLSPEPWETDTIWSEQGEGGPREFYSWEARSASGYRMGGEEFMSASGVSISIPGLTAQQGFVLYHYFTPIEDAARRHTDMDLLMLMEQEDGGFWFLESDLCELGFFVEDGVLTISEGCSC